MLVLESPGLLFFSSKWNQRLDVGDKFVMDEMTSQRLMKHRRRDIFLE